MTNHNIVESEEPQEGADKLKKYEDTIRLLQDPKSCQDEKLTSILDELIDDAQCDDDPVYQGNSLQMLADLASTSHGLSLLEERGVPQKLLEIMDKKDLLIVPHAMKLFYHIKPDLFRSKYSRVLDTIVSYLVSESLELVDYGVDFVAALGRHGYKGREVLYDHPLFKTEGLKKLGSMMKASNGLLKLRTLECVKDLLEVYGEEPAKEECIKLTNDIYHSLIEGEFKMTSHLLMLCENPFPEINTRARAILAVVCDYDWFKKELESLPELKKFIAEKHPMEYSSSHS